MRLDDNVQVYPSRITITPRRANLGCKSLVDNYAKKLLKPKEIEQYKKNFSKKAKDFNLSKSSKSKIFDSINTMYCLSKPRKITMKNGKTLHNYRMSFITLTLPSKQIHSDIEIKSHCVNQLLFELKRKYKIQNFVWKAELQKNKNIHFHLVLDQYVDFQMLRRRWNRIINKLGYVDEYQKKFSSLSLLEYNNIVNADKKTDFKTISERYAKGKKCNWTNPNSVDVRSVLNKKDLAVYLGKYFAKDPGSGELSEDEIIRLENFGRIWSRSYTLVQLKFQHKFLVSEVQDVIKYLRAHKSKVKEVVGDFFTVFYFNVSELHINFQKFHDRYMQIIANIFKYPMPI